jgi:hypothetical protein
MNQNLADLQDAIELTTGDRVSSISAYRIRDDGIINLVYRVDSGWQDCEIDAEQGLFRANPIKSRYDSVIYDLDSLVEHTDSQIDLTPTDAVRKAFKKGLAAYEKYGGGDGLEPATVKEARAIAAGKPVTIAKLKKAYRWFARNGRMASYPEGSPAKVAWGLWGGAIFRAWVNQKVQELEAADRTDAVRPSCINCVEKHLSRAIALFEELPNYPEHRLLAIGNLAEAESESADEMPELSEKIRQIRIQYQETNEPPDFRELVEALKNTGNWRGDAESQAKGRSDSDPKVQKVMKEFKEGKLKSSNGKKIADRKQAIAVALSESKREKAHSDAFPVYREKVELQPGIVAGITHTPSELRNGYPMAAKYGHIIGTYGQAEDGKAHDILLGDSPDSPDLFKIWQTTPTGEFDEHKYIAHCPDMATAKALYLKHYPPSMFGMIAPANWEEISPKKFDAADDEEPPEEEDELSDEDQAIADEWNAVAPQSFDGILEAKDKDSTLAAGIAATVLLAAWLYDRKRGQYLRPNTRKPLTDKALEALAEYAIAHTKTQLTDIHNQGLNDAQWQNTVWPHVEWLHTASYALGKGGFHSMTDEDRAKLQEILDFQREKLQGFKGDRSSMSEPQQLARILKYAQSAYGSFKAGEHQAAIAQGMTEAKRILNPQAEHCKQCPEYAAMGWGPISKAILPGQQCDCQNSCRCGLIYR